MERALCGKITSRENPLIKETAKLAAGKKHRREQGCFLAEGLRLCQDAVHSGLVPRRAFVTQEMAARSEVQALLQQAQECYLLGPGVGEKLSDTKTPQGIFCVFPMPRLSFPDRLEGRRFLLLSSLQDPGNVGTILRTGEAFGVDRVILSEDCPDLFSPKVLRATMGGVFRLPVSVTEDLEGTIRRMRGQGIAVYGAALGQHSVPITQLDFSRPSAVVIGNEGNGLTRQILDCCSASMVIPMEGRAESLNAAVAASISIWEMSRR